VTAIGTGTGTRTRKVVEQAVIFQLKPNISDAVKENMVQGFTDLKANSPEWVVAESAGPVLQPSQLEGAGVGLFMRFFSEEDLGNFFTSKQRRIVSEKYVLPYTTDVITMHFDAKVDDNNETVYRQGDAFKSGAERIVGIKVKNDTSQEEIDTMIKSLNDLIDVPEFSSLLIQITAGTNFCGFDQRYSHGLVVRCASLEALHIYSKHPLHIGVISKTVWPIAENLVQADYIVDGSGARRSISSLVSSA